MTSHDRSSYFDIDRWLKEPNYPELEDMDDWSIEDWDDYREAEDNHWYDRADYEFKNYMLGLAPLEDDDDS